MLSALLVIWSMVLLLWFYLQRRHFLALGSKIPGPPTYPVLGNAIMFMGRPEKAMKTLYRISKEYRRVASIWVGPLLYVLVFDARDVEMILKSKHTEKAEQYKFLKAWLGESVLTNSGERFRRSKKLIMPSFQTNNLREFIPIFYHHSKQMVKDLQYELDKEEFDVIDYITMCTMNVLMETSLGVNKDSLGKEKIVSYSKAIEKLGKCAHVRLYNLMLHPDFTFKYSNLKKEQDECLQIVHPVVEQVIDQRKKEISIKMQHETETGETVKKGAVFVDRFLLAKGEDGSVFTDKEIRDEVSTMMFGGQDTTTVSAGFALSLLGYYQDVQDKVMVELDEVFGDSKRPPSYEDLQKLQYLEQVIQETWRLYPPIPYIGKKATQDIPMENCVIPAGATMGIIIMVLHRNPDVFPDPDKFNPDHFLPERVKERHPYAFIPFSSGTRTCVGRKYAMLVLKVMLSTILRNYRIFAKKSQKEYKLAALTTLRRRDGFTISIKRRNTHTINARG